MEINVLWYFVLLPLVIGLVNSVLPVMLKKIMTLAVTTLSLVLAFDLFSSSTQPVELIGYTIFTIDSLGRFTIIFIQLLSFLILLFALKGVSKESEAAFFVWYPMTIAFCNGVVLSENLIVFLFFWGLSGLMLYFFALLGTTDDTPQTAKKVFILIGGSDAFLIMGVGLIWFIQPENGWNLNSYSVPLDSFISVLAFILFLIAALAKAGGFPLHTWVPDFSKDAPVEGAAFLPASLDKLLGIFLLARMMTGLFQVSLIFHLIVVTIGALTVITAVMMAMNQHNGRRLLGYHAVSQVGYMIMGIGSGNVIAFTGGLFHLVNHTIYKSGLFLGLGAVEKKTGTNELDELGGLGKVMPFTFITSLIAALSISGIPPFNGFFSKWMIYQGLLEKTSTLTPGYQIWMLTCILLAVFGSALTLASFMKFIHAVFLGKVLKKWESITEAPFNQNLSTGLLAFLCVFFGIFAMELPVRFFIMPVIRELGWSGMTFTGLYSPMLVVILLGISFFLGLAVYLMTKNVRYDDTYICGNADSEEYRVSGTDFYKEIREMYPLKPIFNAAENHWFDIYHIGGNLTFAFSRMFQKAHPGQLQLYVYYIVLGVLIFLLLNH
jgi:formate hydrogenlyase subunit 3/multisubunit Na+/H+ antiporter MnhD subunit